MAEFEEYAIPEATVEERLHAHLIGDKSLEKNGLTPIALSPTVANKITRDRIRYAFSELAALNVDNVHRWLSEVAQQSPAKAIELFMELAEFTMPKLKATAIDVRSGDGSVRNISYAELAAKVVQE